MDKMVCGLSSERWPAEQDALVARFAKLVAHMNPDESQDSIRDWLAQAISIGTARIDHVLRQGAWWWELAFLDGAVFLPVAGIPDRPLGGKDEFPILVK
jgi:hypothetical protein